ncbi:protein kinase [Saccharopolyspora indica]|uniref:serine/threonine protein kinase n=1 Tax=Saccharopolyspora indica TaxID=1229659 RepID=UPI0022EA9027|nr:protein kinase [Saccharopolyspora indica]MDA3647185.1 protein kinase [Saccharopolyspora indica]
MAISEDMSGDLVPWGTGPAATVLAGERKGAGEAFALKVYPGGVDRRTRAQLTAELGALAALRGRVPVLVADAAEDLPDGRFALRMELCSESLAELVASSGPMSVPDALDLGESLATALAAAHGAGVVHGGVTPGNVLFRPSGEAVLSDFGLALRRAFPPDPERAVDFLPPETVRDGSADERSDLYGLGAVLRFALSGTAPHPGRSGERSEERLLRVLDGTPVPALERTDLPPGLVQLLSALLAKDPHARPLDAAAVAVRLGELSGLAAVAQDAAFDDFGDPGDDPPTVPLPAIVPASAPAPGPPPLGTPILEFGPADEPKRAFRTGRVLAGLGVLSVLAAAAVLLVRNPEEVAVPQVTAAPALPSTAGVPAIPPVELELLDAVDRGNYVELSWRSSEPVGGEPLDFVIVVAAEGEPTRHEYVQRVTTYRLAVDPVRKYCFRIQGGNSRGAYESEYKSIRRAVCAD